MTDVDAAAAEETTRTRRPGGSPVVLVLMLLVVVPSVLLADLADAGPAAILGGLVGLFSLIGFMGGPLRADLRFAAVMAPALVFAAVVPRLVAQVSRPAAIALVVLVVLVAALLPLRGQRFANAGTGLGMTTLFAYGYAIQGTADHRQLVAAALAGVAVALLLRLLLGATDPSKPTREQVADVLVADDPVPATSRAFDTWLSDGRPRWLATVLEGAARYRLAVRRSRIARGGGEPDPALAALQERAARLADLVKARKPPPEHLAAPDAAEAPQGHLAAAADALDAVARAARLRDTTPVRLTQRRDLRDAVLHPSARLRSVQVRHAIRTAFGILVMLLVVLPLEPGDPLISTVLLATFSILQASWRDTLAKARAKVIGVVAGSATVAVVLLVVPERFLTLIALAALCVGLWYITTRPALGNAAMVLVSVGMNASTRDLDPGPLLVQYAALTLTAVVVGLVLGFTVVPSFRPPPLRRRIESATASTSAVLRASAAPAARPGTELLALQRDAVQKQNELVPDRESLDDQQQADLQLLRTGLGDLLALIDTGRLDPRSLAVAADVLDGGADTGASGAPSPGADSDDSDDGDDAPATLWDLAEQTGRTARALLRTLPDA